MSGVLIGALDLGNLPNEVAPLQELVISLARQLECLQQQLLNLRRRHFGATSEQLLALQPELFVETVSVPMPPTVSETVSYERRSLRGRPRLPKDLPRVRVEYDLAEEHKAQFEVVEKIGEQISETLDYTPAKVVVIEHVRAKYRCEKDGET